MKLENSKLEWEKWAKISACKREKLEKAKNNVAAPPRFNWNCLKLERDPHTHTHIRGRDEETECMKQKCGLQNNSEKVMQEHISKWEYWTSRIAIGHNGRHPWATWFGSVLPLSILLCNSPPHQDTYIPKWIHKQREKEKLHLKMLLVEN